MLNMKLEVVVIPVSDVDRAKGFYSRLGWRLDADRAGDGFRLIQFTPPGSACSVQFGVNLTPATPGSAQILLLIVSDIEAARQQLVTRGIDASEVFHCENGTACRFAGVGVRVSGVQPERVSYSSFVSFSDPDGNSWVLQEVTTRLPGRIDAGATSFSSTSELASALRRAAAAHGQHEAMEELVHGQTRRVAAKSAEFPPSFGAAPGGLCATEGQADKNWPDWYAEYLVREQAGQDPPQ